MSLGTVVAGGTAPYAAQWLLQITGSAKAPAWWGMGAALIAVIASLMLREPSHDKLPV